MDRLIQQIEQEWNESHLVEKGDHIVVGISGGADSVCLLAVLYDLMERWELTITAVHINHSIRKETAVRDADFVTKLCKEWKIPCYVETLDVLGMAKRKGISVEEAGRIARYHTFEKLRKQVGADKIAVAHHMDDDAETILFQLVRGSGLRGMGGMEKRRGIIIRPLLSLTRRRIEIWLSERLLSYVTDETNLSQEYTRNKIRLTLFPYLETEISEKAREHIVNCGKICLEADDYLTNEAVKWLNEYGRVDETGAVEIVRKDFQKLHPAMKKYVIRQAINGVAGNKKDIMHGHVEGIVQLFDLPVGKRLCLPEDMYAKKMYDRIKIGKKKEMEDGPKVKIGECQMIISDFPYKKNEKIPESIYTKWFDYDTIKHAVSLRTRLSGDRISVVKGGNKKLKDYMIDAKIPKEWRETIPLVADGNQILWVVGYRIAEDYKVTEQTKKILQIVIRRENETDEEGVTKDG